jgi:hypothetical protein
MFTLTIKNALLLWSGHAGGAGDCSGAVDLPDHLPADPVAGVLGSVWGAHTPGACYSECGAEAAILLPIGIHNIDHALPAWLRILVQAPITMPDQGVVGAQYLWFTTAMWIQHLCRRCTRMRRVPGHTSWTGVSRHLRNFRRVDTSGHSHANTLWWAAMLGALSVA